MAHQALHQRRLRINHVNSSVKDRSRLIEGGRLRSGVGHLLCPP